MKLTVEDVIPRRRESRCWPKRKEGHHYSESNPPDMTLFWRAISEWAPKIRVLHWHQDDRIYHLVEFRDLTHLCLAGVPLYQCHDGEMFDMEARNLIQVQRGAGACLRGFVTFFPKDHMKSEFRTRL